MLARLPITVSAPLIVGAPALVLGLWLSVMWNGRSREGVRDLAERNIEQVHLLAETTVGEMLSAPVRICRVNEHLIRTGLLDPDDLAAWRATFTEQARAFRMLSAITWGGGGGRSAWVSRYPDGSYYWALKDDPDASTMNEWRIDEDGGIASTPSNTFEFDLFGRPWFRSAADAGEAAWSEPFVWLGGGDGDAVTLGISYGIPMYDRAGGLIGVIDADFSLNDLSGFLRSVEIGETGVAVLTGGDGRLLASSSRAAPIVSEDGRRLRAAESPDPRVAAAAGLLGDDFGAELGAHAALSIGGARHTLLTSSIGRALGLDWTLATIVPERDFTADIEAGFRRSWITGLLAVGAAVGVGLAAARWLVSPLVQLVTAVRRIGQGDLATRVELRHAPEYTRLGAEINEMAVGLQDRLRMRESLSLAMEVQRNLLPSGPPDIHGLDIAGHSTYCDETGGDYYDFLDVSGVEDDVAVVAMGDVMGHGVAAAMLMATARGILRSRCAVKGSLADFLEHLNEMLVEDTGGERFMTMLLLTVNADTGELRWASAGHGPPIVYHARSGTFPELSGWGLPLGIMEGEDYTEQDTPSVEAGDLIVAATDGLWETQNQEGELYGMERLQALLREHAGRSAESISQAIRDALARFRGPAEPEDDLTFVIVKVR